MHEPDPDAVARRLVDQFRLLVFALVLRSGKRLFADGMPVRLGQYARKVRRGSLSVVAFALVAATACAGDAVPAGATPWSPPATPTSEDERWSGRVETGATGELTAPGFNSFIDSAAPSWADSPASAAAELLHMGHWDGPVEAYLDVEEGRRGATEVTVILTRLGDDSVSARRYRLTLEAGEDGLYRFASGRWSQRCHPERGQRRFASRSCL